MRYFSKHATALLIVAYSAIRLLSFLTWHHPVANAGIALIIIIGFAFISFKQPATAWIILAAEFLLDGSGHFFQLGGFILRTWLLGIFAAAWISTLIRERRRPRLLLPSMMITLGIFGGFLALAIIRGYFMGNGPLPIFQDAMLFFFIAALFPNLEFTVWQHHIAPVLLRAYLVGSALFSAITLGLYASGIGTLPDTYYHWFRNVAAGKITDLGNHFFRIVLPEHLFIVPIILVIAAYLMRAPKKRELWFAMSIALFTLALNFSRIYFLALAVGFVVLLYRQSLRHWFTVSALTATSLLIIFMSTHGLASRGTSLGLELLGVRSAGISSPTTDVSGAIRLALLPDIIKTIQEHPWLGSGLATEVEFLSPVTGTIERRTQFDWGYLELIAELGIIGTLSYLLFLGTIVYHLGRRAFGRKLATPDDESPLLRGLFAGALSLAVINLTTPALFQGFGVLYFAFLAALVGQRNHDNTIEPNKKSR